MAKSQVKTCNAACHRCVPISLSYNTFVLGWCPTSGKNLLPYFQNICRAICALKHNDDETQVV